MSVFNSALFVINETYADEYVKQHMTPLKVTRELADAGLLATEPKVIRTRDELAALDPDTMLVSSEAPEYAFEAREPQEIATQRRRVGRGWLPAVVIATGDQVRAARQTLKEEADG